ncbi:MAG: InlB B-repeat-containing protein [Clostridia bacterium]|nr:InlB B-repeat-containing protein [Clostridia bacterium]
MKVSLKKKMMIILLIVLLSIVVIFFYKNTKEDYNLTSIKASELEGKNSENSVTYTIIFDAKGGTGGPDRIESIRPNGIIPGEAPEKTGYVFLGWGTKSNPNEIWGRRNVYYNLEELSQEDINADGTVTLYAIWGRQINFHTGNAYEIFEIYVSEEGEHTMTDKIPTPSHTGLKFEGWATKSKPNRVWCVAGGKYKLTILSKEDINDDGTVTLYAVWSRKIILDKGEDDSTEFYVIAKEDHTMTSEEPTKPGFKFEGWATKSKPNQVWCVAGGRFNLDTLSEGDINDDGSITLVPVWKEDTKPINPDEGNTKPTNPDEGNTKPTNPNEGNAKPTNPNGGNTNPTNQNKNNTDHTSNKKDTNSNQLNTAPMPLSYAGNETKYEKIVIIGILACTTVAIVLYFKLKNANY